MVAGSGGGATTELASLLHRRLRFLSLLFAALLGIVPLVVLGSRARDQGSPWFLALRMPPLVITSLLAIVLWSRKNWTMAQLRLVELLLFGTLIVYYLIRSHFLLDRGVFPHAVGLVAQQQDGLA